jgi:hypothetical protein
MRKTGCCPDAEALFFDRFTKKSGRPTLLLLFSRVQTEGPSDLFLREQRLHVPIQQNPENLSILFGKNDFAELVARDEGLRSAEPAEKVLNFAVLVDMLRRQHGLDLKRIEI